MLALLRRELNEFFGSLTAYFIIVVFLLVNSLFLWILPSSLNVLDVEYANLDSLFQNAPWLYLFLIPALCMKLFSSEIKSGTIELLLIRPISLFKVVLAKFLTGTLVVLFSLVPTLLYFASVYHLGNPVGNIDLGATWGSFIGLLFLALSYVSIGTFASSLTSNPIVAFLWALVLCFFFYLGFEYIGSTISSNTQQSFLISLGINEHYLSLSRGVIDSRDVVYFLALTASFLYLTTLSLSYKR